MCDSSQKSGWIPKLMLFMIFLYTIIFETIQYSVAVFAFGLAGLVLAIIIYVLDIEHFVHKLHTITKLQNGHCQTYSGCALIFDFMLDEELLATQACLYRICTCFLITLLGS